MAQAQPESMTRPRCSFDNHLLDKTGKCWYCGGIYPVSRPALTVVNTEAQVGVETLETMTVDKGRRYERERGHAACGKYEEGEA